MYIICVHKSHYTPTVSDDNVVYYNIHCTTCVFVFIVEITDMFNDVNHTLQFYLAQCQSDCRVRTWLPQQDLMLTICSCLNN